MKTAVSIPDDVFDLIERLVKRAKRSRSEVYSAALREYAARHAPDDVTEAINRVCGDTQRNNNGFIATAGRRILERTEW